MQLIPKEALGKWPAIGIHTTGTSTKVFSSNAWNAEWEIALMGDHVYQGVRGAQRNGDRDIPRGLQLKMQLSDCKLDGELLRYKGSLWVPGALFATEADWKGSTPESEKGDLLRT